MRCSVGHPSAERAENLPTGEQAVGQDSVQEPGSTADVTPVSAGHDHLGQCGSKTTLSPARVTRRVTGGLLLATIAAMFGSYGAPMLPGCGLLHAQARPPPPLPLPPCSTSLDGQLAAALTRAVYSSVVQLQVMDVAQFQRENFKLREREYRYYAEANRSQLPRIPDLADNAGGLSNPAYFNFISYCLWKVVYRHVTELGDREAFAAAGAEAFLRNLGGREWAEQPQAWTVGGAAAAAAAAPPETEREAAVMVREVVLPFLELLRAGGYICRYQLVLGSHPGDWPQDWMSSQPVVIDVSVLDSYDSDTAAGEQQLDDDRSKPPSRSAEAEPGSPDVTFGGGGGGGGEFLFQVKLHRPADLLANVALRSEEGGAWPRTVSRCLQQLLARRGYGPAEAAETAGSSAADGQREVGLIRLAECDEFFYQDQWQAPSSWTDRLLLFLGDPLEQVGVDFVPTTLVQNWRLRGPGLLGVQ